MRVIAVVGSLIALVPTADAQLLTVDTPTRGNAATTGLAVTTATQPAATTDLRDIVRFDLFFDAETQGAGTSNRSVLSAFIPMFCKLENPATCYFGVRNN
mgnify:CR=1 FL=1